MGLNTYNYNNKERVLYYSENEIMGYVKRLLLVKKMTNIEIDFTTSFLKETVTDKNNYNLSIIEEIRPEYLI